MSKQVYLDNNATTPADPEVVESMMPYLTSEYGNASSVHHKGIRAEQAVNKQRRVLADRLHVNSDNFYFMSGGTEANNMVIKGVARRTRKSDRHIITTATEHSSVREVIRDLEENGFEITTVYPDKEGRINADQITRALREDTCLVSVMHVNNETGVIYPVEKIGKMLKSHDTNAVFHVDGVQAFGKYPVDLTHIDAYTISGHKIHAPKGIGALYLADEVNIEPLILGGGQESGLRSGTENVPGIVGLGKAAEIMYEEREQVLQRLSDLREELAGIIQEFPDARINTFLENSVPTTLNVSFPPIPGEVIVNGLSDEGVYVSSGSACASRKSEGSHVLEAMGLKQKYISSSVRFSFSRMNTVNDIRATGEVLKKLVPRLKKVAKLQN